MARTHDLLVADGVVKKTFISWDRGEHEREWAVLRLVHRHAADLVPRPVSADLDSVPPSLTMTLVPGEPLMPPLTTIQRDAVAAAVKRLWDVPVGSELPPWSDDLDFARRLTSGPRPVYGIVAEAYDAAYDWWQGPDPALLSEHPRETVLGHRDPNPANYLWDGQRVRIVDLEDAGISDRATEVAIMAEHLAWREAGTVELAALFNVDPDRLRAARRLWAMFWLRLLLPGGPSEHRNPPGTADRQARHLLSLLTHPGNRP